MKIKERLLELADDDYKAFSAKLMPTVKKESVLGVKVPQLRKLAKEMTAEERLEFISKNEHEYFEEYNLHAFIIELICDFDECVKRVDEFLPSIDNWATCDGMKPKVFKTNPDGLLKFVCKWLKSEHTYTLRYAMLMLMTHFLDERFSVRYLEWVARVKNEDYYVKMMQAWYFATALAKQYDYAIAYLSESKLDGWVHNKTIRKAIESYRISDEKKKYLRSLTIK